MIIIFKRYFFFFLGLERDFAMRIATIIKDLSVYRNYPPFLEKLTEKVELHLLHLRGEAFEGS
ncbi:MAG: hypothetical protein DRJ59_06155, partial [Thermoprotei archaeon]